MYHTERPTDKTIREWYMKFQQSGCLHAANYELPCTTCFFPLPTYSHHIRILGFKATRIPKIMFRSSERDTVTGGNNEYY